MFGISYVTFVFCIMYFYGKVQTGQLVNCDLRGY